MILFQLIECNCGAVLKQSWSGKRIRNSIPFVFVMFLWFVWLILLFVKTEKDNQPTNHPESSLSKQRSAQPSILGTYCRFYIRHVARRWRRIPRLLRISTSCIWRRIYLESFSRKVFYMIGNTFHYFLKMEILSIA